MRPLLHVGAFLLGALVALASVAVHRETISGFPAGLVLALAASLSTGWALRRLGSLHRLAASYALGWVVLLGFVVAGRPEGDYAIAGDFYGYSLMGASVVMVVAGITALPANRAERDRSGS